MNTNTPNVYQPNDPSHVDRQVEQVEVDELRRRLLEYIVRSNAARNPRTVPPVQSSFLS